MARFTLLESFQLLHPYPAEITRTQLGILLSKLPHLTKFILNPHPGVHTGSSFGADVLSEVARRRPELQELGLFFNKNVNLPLKSTPVTPFHSLKLFYHGTSTVPGAKKPFKDLSCYLLSVFPPDTEFSHYPENFAFVKNKRSFAILPITHEVVDARLRPATDAAQLWIQVKETMDLIRDLKADLLTN